jgi:hypothetical protein
MAAADALFEIMSIMVKNGPLTKVIEDNSEGEL